MLQQGAAKHKRWYTVKLMYSWSTDQHPADEPTEVAMLSKKMQATQITQNKMTWQYSHDKHVPITKQI